MNRKTVFFYLILAWVCGCAGCSRNKTEETPSKERLIFNCDGTDLLGNFLFGGRPLSVADVRAYVDAYVGTQVTTFMMCSGAHNLYYRSAYTPVIGEPRDGQPEDKAYREGTGRYYEGFRDVEREGADVIATVLERARERKMETFITYRMNDLHFNSPDESPSAQCNFWRDHPEYWTNEDVGWHSSGAFDFANPEVRRFKLDIISEQIDKYGHLLDGFDLDFMRFIVYFKQAEGEKNAPLMTGLVKAVKAKMDEASAQHGRKILLSVRVPADVAFCLSKGLDVREWIRLGLVDFVTIGVHWCGKPDMPVEKFRNDLGAPGLPLYATIDDGGYGPREVYTQGQRRGMASHIYAQGGNGIYLFNYFLGGGYDGDTGAGSVVSRAIRVPLLHELGSPETLRKRNKIFSLDDGASAAYGYKPDTPLPLTVSAEKPSAATVYVGDPVNEDAPAEAVLFVRTNRPDSLVVRVNETGITRQKPEYVVLFDRGNNLSNDETVYAWTIPVSALRQGVNSVSFHTGGGALTVKRVEIALKYGDVEKNGYF